MNPWVEAREALERGWSVFPMGKNGRYLIDWKEFQSILPSPEQIDEWEKTYSNEGYGVVTGSLSGLLVVDVDMKNGHRGDIALKELFDPHGGVPSTVVAHTPTNGWHIYFKFPEGKEYSELLRNSTSKIGDGLDVRAEGGMVSGVGLPKRTWSKGRSPKEVAVAAMPDWLIQTIIEAKKSKSLPIVTNVNGKIPHGSRHESLKTIAIDMYYKGSQPDGIRHALEHEAKFNMDPPLTDSEIETEVNSPNGIVNWVVANITPRTSIGALKPTVPVVLPFKSATEILRSEVAKINWKVKGFIALLVCVELNAKVKIGKTTLMFALIKCLVSGTPFLGIPVEKCKVLLFTEERDVTLKATLDRTGITETDDFHILKNVDITGDPTWEEKCAAITEYAINFGAEVVFVDTLSKLAEIKDENNNAEGSVAMAPLERMANQGLAVWANRHERKSGGEIGDSGRGGSSISGSSDVLLQLTKADPKNHPNRRTLNSVGRVPDLIDKITIEWDEHTQQFFNLGGESNVEQQKAENLIDEYLPTNTYTSLEDFLAMLVENDKASSRSTMQRALKAKVASGVVGGKDKIAGKSGRAYGYTLLTVPSLGNDLGQNNIPTQEEHLPSPHSLGGQNYEQPHGEEETWLTEQTIQMEL